MAVTVRCNRCRVNHMHRSLCSIFYHLLQAGRWVPSGRPSGQQPPSTTTTLLRYIREGLGRRPHAGTARVSVSGAPAHRRSLDRVGECLPIYLPSRPISRARLLHSISLLPEIPRVLLRWGCATCKPVFRYARCQIMPRDILAPRSHKQLPSTALR